MKTVNMSHTTTQNTFAHLQKNRSQPLYPHTSSQKFRPASRAERLTSWNQRMQSLFTRQTY